VGCGVPDAWSSFPSIAEVWGEEDTKPNLAFPSVSRTRRLHSILLDKAI